MTKSPDLSLSGDLSPLAGLQTLLRTFETVLLATIDRPGEAPHLHARLMSVADVADDCTLSFFSAGRDLVEGRGHVIAQAMTCSVNLTGSFTIVHQRAQMAPLFGQHHKTWFPLGLDEPGLCLITFRPFEAELRDMGRVQRIRLIPELARLSLSPTIGVPARAIVMGCSALAALLAGVAAVQVMVSTPQTASAARPPAERLSMVNAVQH